jgi:hypothetical protein
MDGSRGATGSRHLRSVRAAALEPAALAQEILACLEGASGGMPPRAVPAALAERLALPPSELPARAVETALGLLIATGRADERGGRLVPLGEEHRRAV